MTPSERSELRRLRAEVRELRMERTAALECALPRLPQMADYKHTQTAVEEIGRMLNGLITSLQPE